MKHDLITIFVSYLYIVRNVRWYLNILSEDSRAIKDLSIEAGLLIIFFVESGNVQSRYCMVNEKVQKYFLLSQRFIRYSVFDRCNNKVNRYNAISLHRYICI